MDRRHNTSVAARVPCDYIFVINYHTCGPTAHIIKDAGSEADAWRRLTDSCNFSEVRSITVEAQPIYW